MKLVGPDALPSKERAFLESARMIREDFLQQSAFHEVDTYCPSNKQYEMLRLMLKFSDKLQEAVDKNVHMDDILSMKSRENLARMSTVPNKEFEKELGKKLRLVYVENMDEVLGAVFEKNPLELVVKKKKAAVRKKVVKKKK